MWLSELQGDVHSLKAKHKISSQQQNDARFGPHLEFQKHFAVAFLDGGGVLIRFSSIIMLLIIFVQLKTRSSAR